MPTIDDLRDVLISREVHAGDPAVVRDRLRTPPRRRRVLAPVLAAAAVAGLAAGAAALGAHRTGTGGEQSGAGGAYARWQVSVDRVAGYDVTRTVYVPQYEMGLVKTTSNSGLLGTFWRYGVEAYTGVVSGDPVSIHGRTGYFSGTAKGSQIAWRYAPDSWAVVAGSYVGANGAVGHVAAAKDAELAIARAMHFGASDRVTLPFQLRNLPSQLTLQAAYPHGNTNCVGYGAGDELPTPKPGDEPDDVGTVLTVCRTAAGDRIWRPGDRWVARQLPDRTQLTVAVNHRRLADISAAQVRRIAAQADVSPKFHNQKTWLPIRL
jgi:hypothetical protein